MKDTHPSIHEFDVDGQCIEDAEADDHMAFWFQIFAAGAVALVVFIVLAVIAAIAAAIIGGWPISAGTCLLFVFGTPILIGIGFWLWISS